MATLDPSLMHVADHLELPASLFSGRNSHYHARWIRSCLGSPITLFERSILPIKAKDLHTVLHSHVRFTPWLEKNPGERMTHPFSEGCTSCITDQKDLHSVMHTSFICQLQSHVSMSFLQTFYNLTTATGHILTDNLQYQGRILQIKGHRSYLITSRYGVDGV